MATTTTQRAGIWIIAVVLTVGTVAGFVAMILAPQNEAADSARLAKLSEEYQTSYSAYQEKVSAQQKALDKEATALSKKYYGTFSSYQSKVGKFDRDTAQKELVKQDLKKGTGEILNDDTTYAVYYVGWLPNGTVFDGSIDGKKLKTPLIARPGGTISGWSEGVRDMKIGGIRMLTIPSEKGYGEVGQGDIPANTPLRFIVMPIRVLETIEAPQPSKELLQAYGG